MNGHYSADDFFKIFFDAIFKETYCFCSPGIYIRLDAFMLYQVMTQTEKKIDENCGRG